MAEEFKRWTVKRKAALVTEIKQSKTSVAQPPPFASHKRFNTDKFKNKIFTQNHWVKNINVAFFSYLIYALLFPTSL